MSYNTGNLTYDTIARNASESVAPELWPDHAWVPALGCSGGILPNVCRQGANAILGGTSIDWSPGGVTHTLAGAARWDLPTSIKTETESNASLVMFHKRANRAVPEETAIWELGPGATDHYWYTGQQVYLGAFRSARIGAFYLPSGSNPQLPHVLSVTSEPGDGGWKVYFNGNIATTASGDSTIAWTTGTPNIGQGISTSFYYTGTMYSFSFYWRTLAAQEIATLSDDPLLPFRRKDTHRKTYFFSYQPTRITTPNPPVVMVSQSPTTDTTPEWSWVSGGGVASGVFRWSFDQITWYTTTINAYSPPLALSPGTYTLYVQEKNNIGGWSDYGYGQIIVQDEGGGPSYAPRWVFAAFVNINSGGTL